MSTLKRFVHRKLGCRVFQRSYHDHVVRSGEDYLDILEYIKNNPVNWVLQKNTGH